MIQGKSLKVWISEYPVIESIVEKREFIWKNPNKEEFEYAISNAELTANDVFDASERLRRFASYFKAEFPETAAADGLIESPLKYIPEMQAALEEKYGCTIPGRLMIKLDSHLQVLLRLGAVFTRFCILQKK